MRCPPTQWLQLISWMVFAVLFFGLPVRSSNQAWFVALQVHAGQASNPDLVVSSISNPPASAVPGSTFSVMDTTVNIENIN